LELAFGLPNRPPPGAIRNVSILVFLELAFGPEHGHPNRGEAYPVSILVFLELAFGHDIITATTPKMMFQSLFFWNSPSDLLDPVAEGADDFVSILVFLELAFGLKY